MTTSRKSDPEADYQRRLAKAIKKNYLIKYTLDEHERIRDVKTTAELIALSRDQQDTEIVSSARWLLGHIRGQAAARELIRVAETADDVDVRAFAVDWLSKIDLKLCNDALMRFLILSPHERVRERAASSLRFHKVRPEMTDVLIASLINRSESVCVREMAAEALQWHPEEQVVPAVESVLDDPAPAVRYWAISALSYTKAEHLLPRLDHIAQTDFAEAPDPDIADCPEYEIPIVAEIAAEVAERIRYRIANPDE